MIVLDLYQAYYQILLIIYLKDYISIKNNQLIFRCFDCKKNYKKNSNKKLIKRFANIYKFCDRAFNKVIFLLKIGVYTYEYIDSWERFDEALLPRKKD